MLFAEALGILGYRRYDEVEDLVQDAFMQALARIGQLRHPDAFRWWLRTILRNLCFQHLRGRPLTFEAADADVEIRVEETILTVEPHDRIWAAIELLPENLRATVLLRHFGRCNSYAEIATVLSVPIGTVRSRLSDARGRLAQMLRDAADETCGEILRRQDLEAEQLKQELVALYRGDGLDFFDRLADDLVVRLWRREELVGRHVLENDFLSDISAGVRLEVDEAFTSGSVSLIDGRLMSPAHDPDHCPPVGALLMFGRDAGIDRIHIHLAGEAESHPPSAASASPAR